MAEARPDRILKGLIKEFMPLKFAMPHSNSFETLVRTIISQNTADKNVARAFESLSNQFKIVPEVLAKADVRQIEKCLKVAGLYRSKARVLKYVSMKILDEWNGHLEGILSLPFDEARKTLLQFRGVGPKTADILLLFCARRPTIPVDTHVNRVSKRLGLAPESGDYETVRKSLQSVYNPKDYFSVHVLLISHGRKYCRARMPLCNRCPISEFCPSKGSGDQND